MMQRTMIHSLFSLPIYQTNISKEIDLNEIKMNLLGEFQKSSPKISPLEKNGGISTYSTNNQLHLEDFSNRLNSVIKSHVKTYWKILEIDNRLEPEIDQCWSNIHYQGSSTEYHSHSLMPIVATFYVEAHENCGNLILINPMEYGLTHIPYGVPIENKTETGIKVSTGDLVLFPGWVRHRVEPNYSNNDRIVMSYNFKYKGTYLDSNSKYPEIARPYTNTEVENLRNQVLSLQTALDHLTRNITNDR
jgi:uncharacterized protein (TIGR02466 family)